MEYCDNCQRDIDGPVNAVQVARQTHGSPAEYEQWCDACIGPQYDAEDLAYERAAANFDDSDGRKDWR